MLLASFFLCPFTEMVNTSMAVVPHTAIALSKSEDAEVLVDALPYLDSDYTESDRQMAMQLVEDECRIFRPVKNYLQNMPPPDFDVFLTPCLIKEHVRMSKKQVNFIFHLSRRIHFIFITTSSTSFYCAEVYKTVDCFILYK